MLPIPRRRRRCGMFSSGKSSINGSNCTPTHPSIITRWWWCHREIIMLRRMLRSAATNYDVLLIQIRSVFSKNPNARRRLPCERPCVSHPPTTTTRNLNTVRSRPTKLFYRDLYCNNKWPSRNNNKCAGRRRPVGPWSSLTTTTNVSFVWNPLIRPIPACRPIVTVGRIKPISTCHVCINGWNRVTRVRVVVRPLPGKNFEFKHMTGTKCVSPRVPPFLFLRYSSR